MGGSEFSKFNEFSGFSEFDEFVGIAGDEAEGVRWDAEGVSHRFGTTVWLEASVEAVGREKPF